MLWALEWANQARATTLWSFLIAGVMRSVENCSAKLCSNLTASTRLLLVIDSLLVASLSCVARPRPAVGLVLLPAHTSDGLIDVLLTCEDLPEIVNRKLVVIVFRRLWATCRPHHDLTESYVLLLRCRARFLINRTDSVVPLNDLDAASLVLLALLLVGLGVDLSDGLVPLPALANSRRLRASLLVVKVLVDGRLIILWLTVQVLLREILMRISACVLDKFRPCWTGHTS